MWDHHNDRSTAINDNDDVGTHYYGDGCDDDHGRPDHIAAQFIDDCAPFLIDDDQPSVYLGAVLLHNGDTYHVNFDVHIGPID
jgi:hypothetical protein